MDRLRRKTDLGVHFKIQTDGFLHLLRLPMTYHKSVHINGVLQKISQAGWRVSAIVRTVINIAPQFLSIIIGIVLAMSINRLLASVLLAGVIFYVILLVRILRPIAAIDSAAHRSWNNGWDDAAAAIQQIESVKQATTESYESQKTESALLNRTFNLWYQLERNWSNVSFFQRTIVFLTQLTIFILSVRLMSTNIISIGELVALNGYAMMFFGPFVALGYSWQTIQNGLTTAAHAEEIFDEPEEVYHPLPALTPAEFIGEVIFDNVSFDYGNNQPPVLTDVSFTVKPGEVVALVGESGVGKSTAVTLISGYYFPASGQVLIDGVNTRQLDLTDLRRHIAVVPQEVALFNDTLKSNIRYGSFEASDIDIERAVAKAHLTEFIEKLPQKYETIVGERGVKLSVGQKQRVAIAREILRGPKILILDEPTSALDAKSEKVIEGSLRELMNGRTTFIIAHRLSTVRQADKILVFKDGKIVEQGKHDELITIPDGVYRHLYELQIGLHQ